MTTERQKIGVNVNQIGGKLPSVPTLQAEYEKLQGQKESLYADYGQAEKTGVGI